MEMDFSTMTDFELDKYVKAGNPDAIAELGRRRPAYSPQDQYNAQQKDKAAELTRRNTVWPLTDNYLGQVPGDEATTQPAIVGGVNNAQVDIRPENTWDQNELMGQSIQNIPTTEPITEPAPGGIQPFDDWVKTVPPERLATYGVSIPEQVPAKEPVNSRVFTVPAPEAQPQIDLQKPAGMPSRVWNMINPNQGTDTTVDSHTYNRVYGHTIPSNTTLTDKEKDARYSLDNMNKLKPVSENTQDKDPEEVPDKKPGLKETFGIDQMDPETRKRIWSNIGKHVVEGSNKVGSPLGNVASSTLSEANVSMDPSGQSAVLRQQAEDQMKQAAEMTAFKQQQIQDANVAPEQRAEQYAASSAAAKHAQQSAQAKPGEYVDTVVENPDIAQQQQMQQQYRQQAQELSKDANQYQNAARQRTMDAQKADYDYNENRRINNRIFQLTGGVGVKKDDGSYQVVGGNRDKDNNPVNPEQQPTGNNTTPTNNGNNNTQSADNGDNNTTPTTPDNSSNNNVTPAPASTTSTSTPGSNLANIQDKKQERLDKRDTGTSTSTPEPAAPAENMTVKTLRYANALQQWASLVSKYTRSGQINYDRNAHKEIEAAAKEAEAAHVTGLPKYNLSDMRADNVSRIWRQIQSWQKRFGGN